jgi:2-isopropylmalate synthase
LGYDLGDNALNDAFGRFKDLADKKKEVFDEDLIALVDDAVAHRNERIRVTNLNLTCGIGVRPSAKLELEIDGERSSATADGDGPVDAIFRCIGKLFPHQAELRLFQIQAVTEGTDAQGDVIVRLEENGRSVNGHGADTDTMVASARAYVNALNKLLVKREKTAPEALSA